MKAFLIKCTNFYNTNTLFHSFIQGILGAFISAIMSWKWGAPISKATLIAFLAFMGKALLSWLTRWAQTNLATVAVSMKKSGILKQGDPNLCKPDVNSEKILVNSSAQVL